MQTKIMDKPAIDRAVKRMAHEIVEQNKGLEKLYLVGIQTRGVPLAKRLACYLKEIEGKDIPVGILDITFYRDDLTTISHQPVIKSTSIDFTIEDPVVILCDDVLFTGRTVRAAIDALQDFGRPQSIQLCVLIDRGHRELPIKANYVGKNVPTSKEELIKVLFNETDSEEAVYVSDKPKGK